MQVLEHQDQRRQPTARLHERLQQFARAQADQNAVRLAKAPSGALRPSMLSSRARAPDFQVNP